MTIIQEEMQQRANNVVAAASNPATVEIPVPPCNSLVKIVTMTPGGVSPPIIDPLVIEIDNQ